MWIIFPVLSSISVKKLRDVEFNMRPGSGLQVALEHENTKERSVVGEYVYIYTCVCLFCCRAKCYGCLTKDRKQRRLRRGF